MKEMSSRKAKNLGSIQAADTWIIYVNTCIMEFLEDLKQKHCIATKEKWIWRDVRYEEILSASIHPISGNSHMGELLLPLLGLYVLVENYHFPRVKCVIY